MCKGKTSTTSNAQYFPNPEASGVYSDIMGRIQSAAATPYQGYTGELVAPINAQQTAGIGDINQYAGFGLPYFQQAGTMIGNAAQPLTSDQISNYMNPFTNNVVGSTLNAFDLFNRQQQNNLTGNAAAQHALGGNRVGVAQANLAGQQAAQELPQIAQLYSNAYTQGLGTAMQQYQQNPMMAAYGLGQVGAGGQGTALSGANAVIGAGNLQQQTQQAQDTAAYQQYLQAMGYKFQVPQWEAGVASAIGPQMGGTQQTVTQGPKPSIFGQIAGLGLAGASLMPKVATGGAIRGFADGGMPTGMPGVPYSGGVSWIPATPLAPGRPPQFGAPAGQPSADMTPQQMMQQAKGIAGLANMGQRAYGAGYDYFNGADAPLTDYAPAQDIANPAYAVGPELPDFYAAGVGTDALGFAPEAAAGAAEGAAGGLGSIAEFLPFLFLKRGGGVPGFAEGGGDDSFDDRFGDLTPAVDMIGQGIDPNNRGALLRAAEGLNTYNLLPNDQSPLVARPVATQSYRPVAGFAPETPRIADRPDLPPEITRGASANVQLDDQALGYDRTAGVAPVLTRPPRPEPTRGGLFNLTDDQRMAMLAAGLGMMSSRSPYPLEQVGAGGLTGLQMYRNLQSDRLAAQRLDEQANQHLLQMNMQNARMTQAERFHKDTMTMAGRRLDAENFVVLPGKETEDGHPIGFDRRHPGAAVDMVTGKPIDTDATLKDTRLKFKPYPNKTAEDGSPLLINDRGDVMNASTKQMLGPGSKILDVKVAPLDDQDRRLRAYQLTQGDVKSAYGGMGYGTAAAQNKNAVFNEARKMLVDEGGMTLEQAGKYLSEQTQSFNARGVGMSAEARTAGTREANLNIILKAADAAIPAALEASDLVSRTNWVPVNRLIQAGRVMTSDPNLARFAMSNLQLAEHWARAMNPTGVMRESDRDLALNFLSTTTGGNAYRTAVTQLKMQIENEKGAVHSFLNKNGADTAMGRSDGLTYNDAKKQIDEMMARRAERNQQQAPTTDKTIPPGSKHGTKGGKGGWLTPDGKFIPD